MVQLISIDIPLFCIFQSILIDIVLSDHPIKWIIWSKVVWLLTLSIYYIFSLSLDINSTKSISHLIWRIVWLILIDIVSSDCPIEWSILYHNDQVNWVIRGCLTLDSINQSHLLVWCWSIDLKCPWLDDDLAGSLLITASQMLARAISFWGHWRHWHGVGVTNCGSKSMWRQLT